MIVSFGSRGEHPWVGTLRAVDPGQGIPGSGGLIENRAARNSLVNPFPSGANPVGGTQLSGCSKDSGKGENYHWRWRPQREPRLVTSPFFEESGCLTVLPRDPSHLRKGAFR
jgi:hypothetical protein